MLGKVQCVVLDSTDVLELARFYQEPLVTTVVTVGGVAELVVGQLVRIRSRGPGFGVEHGTS